MFYGIMHVSNRLVMPNNLRNYILDAFLSLKVTKIAVYACLAAIFNTGDHLGNMAPLEWVNV